MTNSLNARVADLGNVSLEAADLADLAYAVGLRRTHFSYLGVVIAKGSTLDEDLQSKNFRTLPSGCRPRYHLNMLSCSLGRELNGLKWERSSSTSSRHSVQASAKWIPS
jgi:hypothetical protein